MIKKSFYAGLFLLMLLSGTALAHRAYVNDIMTITLRRGPGLQFKVLRTLSSGDRIDVLDIKKGWARVRTDNGAEGWVVARYLSDTEPVSRIAQKSVSEIKELSARLESIQVENKRISDEKAGLEKELAETKARLAESKKAFSDLKSASKGFTDLKAEFEKCKALLDKKNHSLLVLEKKLKTERFAAGLKWFLAGAGVLLIGILIGRSSKRERSLLR